MAYNAGDVEAKLTLDRSDFITGMRESQAQAERFERTYTADLDVRDREVRPKLNAIQKKLVELTRKQWDIKLKLNDTGVGTNLTKIKERLTEVTRKQWDIKLRLNATGILPELTKVQTKLNQVAKTYEAKIRLDTTGQAQITQLVTELNTLANKQFTTTVDVNVQKDNLDRLMNQLRLIDARQYRTRLIVDVDDERLMGVTARLRQLANKTYNIKIRVETAGIAKAVAELTALERIVSKLDGRRININVDTDGATNALRSVSQAADGAGQSFSGMSGHTKLVASAVALLASPGLATLSSAFMMVPGVAAAAGASIGVAAMAFEGFGAAIKEAKTPEELKKQQEALAKLSPAAREAAIAFNTQLRPAFQSMQQVVQQNFFAAMQGSVQRLAAALPQLNVGMGQVATGLGGLANQFIITATSADNMNRIQETLSNIGQAMTVLQPAVANFTSTFLQLSAFGSQALIGLAREVTTFSVNWGNMVNNLANTGILTGAFNNLNAVIGALFRMLTTLVDQGMRAMVEVGPSIVNVIDQLSATVVNLMPGLNAVFRAFSALSPIMPVIAQLFSAIAVPLMNALIPAFNALMPIVQQLGAQLGTLLGGAIQALTPLFVMLAEQGARVLQSALNLLAPLIPVIVSAIQRLANAITPLVPVVAELAVQFLNGLAPAIPGLVDAFNKIIDAAIRLMPQFIQLAQTLIPQIVQAMPSVVTVVDDVTTSIKIAADVAEFLIGAFLRVIQTCADLGGAAETVSGFLKDLPEKFTTTGQGIIDGWNGTFGKISNTVRDKLGLSKVFTDDGLQKITDTYNEKMPKQQEDLQGHLDKQSESWLDYFRRIDEPHKQFWADLFNETFNGKSRLNQSLESFWTGLPRNAGFAMGDAVRRFKEGWDQLVNPSMFMDGLNQIGSFISQAAANISDGFIRGLSDMFNPDMFMDGLTQLGTMIKDAAINIGNGFVDGLGQLINPQMFMQGLTDIGTAFQTAAINIGTGFMDGLKQLINPQMFMEGLGDIGEFFRWLGVDVLGGFFQGLEEMWATVDGWIAEKVNEFIQGFKEGLGIASPSTVFIQIGSDIINGLIQGIQQVGAMIGGVASGIVQSVIGAFSGIAEQAASIWNSVSSTASTIWNTVYSTISGVVSNIVSTVGSTLQGIIQSAQQIWDQVSSAATTAWNTIWSTIQQIIQTGIQTVQGILNRIGEIFTTAWERARTATTTALNNIRNVVIQAINAIIGVVNSMLQRINSVSSTFGINIPQVPTLASGGALKQEVQYYATGTSGLGSSPMGSTGGAGIGSGFMTNGPQAVVGEGSTQYPEFVIPTDPRYRENALSLFADLSGHLFMASGGFLSNTASASTTGAGVGMSTGMGAGIMIGTAGGSAPVTPVSEGDPNAPAQAIKNLNDQALQLIPTMLQSANVIKLVSDFVKTQHLPSMTLFGQSMEEAKAKTLENATSTIKATNEVTDVILGANYDRAVSTVTSADVMGQATGYTVDTALWSYDAHNQVGAYMVDTALNTADYSGVAAEYMGQSAQYTGQVAGQTGEYMGSVGEYMGGIAEYMGGIANYLSQIMQMFGGGGGGGGGLFDTGGFLPKGQSMVQNNTGKQEKLAVFNPNTWQGINKVYDSASDLAKNSGNGNTTSSMNSEDIDRLIKAIEKIESGNLTIAPQLPPGSNMKDVMEEVKFNIDHRKDPYK